MQTYRPRVQTCVPLVGRMGIPVPVLGLLEVLVIVGVVVVLAEPGPLAEPEALAETVPPAGPETLAETAPPA